MNEIKEHMEVIGADGAHVGTVDKVEGKRIKLTKADSGEGRHKGHHHFIELGLVAEVEGQKVRLSANGDVAVTMEEEASKCFDAEIKSRPLQSGLLFLRGRQPSAVITALVIFAVPSAPPYSIGLRPEA